MMDPRALDAGDTAMVMPHTYNRAEGRGPHRCTCGRRLIHRVHPHEALARGRTGECVCGMPMEWKGHT